MIPQKLIKDQRNPIENSCPINDTFSFDEQFEIIPTEYEKNNIKKSREPLGKEDKKSKNAMNSSKKNFQNPASNPILNNNNNNNVAIYESIKLPYGIKNLQESGKDGKLKLQSKSVENLLEIFSKLRS